VCVCVCVCLYNNINTFCCVQTHVSNGKKYHSEIVQIKGKTSDYVVISHINSQNIASSSDAMDANVQNLLSNLSWACSIAINDYQNIQDQQQSYIRENTRLGMGLLLIGLAVFFRSKITNRIKNTEERGGTNDLNDNKSNIIINNNNNTNNNSKYKRKQAQTDEFRMIPDDYFNDVTSDDEFS